MPAYLLQHWRVLCDFCKLSAMFRLTHFGHMTFRYSVENRDNIQSLTSQTALHGIRRHVGGDVEPCECSREEVAISSQFPERLFIAGSINFNTLPLNFPSSSRYVRSLRLSTLMYLQ